MDGVLTESAVVLSGSVYRPVGEYLQLEAGAAVELSPAQDALQVAKIRQRSALQSALNQTQPLIQTIRQRHIPQCWKSLQIQIDAPEKSSHLCHDEETFGCLESGEERDALFICDQTERVIYIDIHILPEPRLDDIPAASPSACQRRASAETFTTDAGCLSERTRD